MYCLWRMKGRGPGGNGRLIERELIKFPPLKRGAAYLRGGLNRGFTVYIFRFVFTSSLPLYDFLQVIGFGHSGGVGSKPPPKARKRNGWARAWLLILPWVPWPSTITHFLYVQGYALSRKFSWILWFIILFITEVCLEVRRYKRPLFLNKWPAPFDTCPQVSQTRQKSGLR